MGWLAEPLMKVGRVCFSARGPGFSPSRYLLHNPYALPRDINNALMARGESGSRNLVGVVRKYCSNGDFEAAYLALERIRDDKHRAKGIYLILREHLAWGQLIEAEALFKRLEGMGHGASGEYYAKSAGALIIYYLRHMDDPKTALELYGKALGVFCRDRDCPDDGGIVALAEFMAIAGYVDRAFETAGMASGSLASEEARQRINRVLERVKNGEPLILPD